MKTLLIFSLIAMWSLKAVCAIVSDPVEDYIKRESTIIGGDSNFYADDRVLVIKLDLSNTSQQQTLVSLSRDQNGKMGNVWTIYNRSGGGFEDAGTIVFHQGRFYVGTVDEIGGYGLVNFWPSGGGEGTIFAYTYDGLKVTEHLIGKVSLDQATKQYKGRELLEKYLGAKATIGDEVITYINIIELAEKYGIKVQDKTYVQSLRDGSLDSQEIPVPNGAQSTPPSKVNHLNPAIQTPIPQIVSAKVSAPANRDAHTHRALIILLVSIVLCIVGFATYWLSRKYRVNSRIK